MQIELNGKKANIEKISIKTNPITNRILCAPALYNRLPEEVTISGQKYHKDINHFAFIK